jgi:hypothetical protein
MYGGFADLFAGAAAAANAEVSAIIEMSVGQWVFIR